MFRARFQSVIDEPWLRMKPISVGPVPMHQPEADGYVVVWRDDDPYLRIDAYATQSGGPFSDCLIWGRFVMLGWCDVVHMIDLRSCSGIDISCDWYFGSFHVIDEKRLLVTTASALICIDQTGAVLWRSEPLGIDGVLIKAISDAGSIEGEGEWDPPGGWKPFQISMRDGRLV